MDMIIFEPLLTNRPLDILDWQLRQPSGLIYVYHLLCPIKMTVRYIGISQEPYKRFLHHLKANTRTRKTAWIKNLAKRDKSPFIFIYEGFADREKAKSTECSLIGSLKSDFPLTNLTLGGDYPSLVPMSDSVRASYRERMLTKNPSFGGLSIEHKEKIRQSSLIVSNSSAVRAKRSKQAHDAKRDTKGRFA